MENTLRLRLWQDLRTIYVLFEKRPLSVSSNHISLCLFHPGDFVVKKISSIFSLLFPFLCSFERKKKLIISLQRSLCIGLHLSPMQPSMYTPTVSVRTSSTVSERDSVASILRSSSYKAAIMISARAAFTT